MAPVGPCFDVIAARQVMGPALLAPNFESSAATIPADAARVESSCSPIGRADQVQTTGTGSKLVCLISYAYQFAGDVAVL